MCITRIAGAVVARQTHDEGTIIASGKLFERFFYFADVVDFGHATGTGAQLAGCLRPPDQELAQDRGLLRCELESPKTCIAESVLVFRHATAKARSLHH